MVLPPSLSPCCTRAPEPAGGGRYAAPPPTAAPPTRVEGGGFPREPGLCAGPLGPTCRACTCAPASPEAGGGNVGTVSPPVIHLLLELIPEQPLETRILNRGEQRDGGSNSLAAWPQEGLAGYGRRPPGGCSPHKATCVHPRPAQHTGGGCSQQQPPPPVAGRHPEIDPTR